jgi:hypothetical protein
MQSKKVAGSAQVDVRSVQVAPSLERELHTESEDHWDLAAERLDGFGPALIEISEAGAEHRIKTDLLDQFVSIVRRKHRPDERAREIAKLMQQMRRR